MGEGNVMARAVTAAGALIMLIAAFCPLYEDTPAFTRVVGNSLVQHGGWLLPAAALGIAFAAYFAGPGNVPRALPLALSIITALGLLLWAADDGDRTLYPVGPDGVVDHSQLGVVVPFGIAIYLAGIGVTLSLIGSIMLTKIGPPPVIAPYWALATSASGCGARSVAATSRPRRRPAGPAGQLAPAGGAPARFVGRNRKRRRALPGVLVAAVLALVLMLVACGGESAGSPSSAGSQTGSGSSGASGTFDEWRDAVCYPGYYFPGSQFPGTTDGGSCFGRNGPNSSRGDMVYLTVWPSTFDLQNAMARYHMTSYVEVTDGGAPAAFSVNFNAHSDTALQPLTRFGFTITTV